MKTNKYPQSKVNKRLRESIQIAFAWLVVLWMIHGFNLWGNLDLKYWGIYPQRLSGLVGIIFSPWIHSTDHSHLLSNSVPLFVLAASIIFFYKDISFKVFGGIYLLSGLAVWLVGQRAYHIGASGLIYGMAAFLFFNGVFRKNKAALGISLIIAFLYGSMVWGVLPIKDGISWESHLFGAIAGVCMAFVFRRGKESEFIKTPHQFPDSTDNENIPWDYKNIIPPPEGFKYPNSNEKES